MLPSRVPLVLATRFAAVGAGSGSTGIEHALKFKQTGGAHKQDFKDYKCSEYLHFNTYSYYSTEDLLAPSRVPQPTNKKPDVMPHVKQ